MRAAKAQTSLRTSALTAHKHIEEIHAVAVNLKSVKPLRWWGHLGIRFVYHTSVDVCTPTLLHAKISLRTAQPYQHLCF